MSTFALKMVALLLMVIDHVGYFFDGAPVWFRWLGRGSYPLFLFCLVWGYHYTRDRRKYLLRLYGMSVFMTVFMLAVEVWFPAGRDLGYHNIFLPMFLVGFLISTIETFAADRRKGAVMLGALCGVQLLYYILPGFIPGLRQLSGDILTGIIPNLAINEYGFPFIALGVLLYFVRENRAMLCATYLLFCMYQLSAEMLEYGMAVQWMMIIALPFMMQYNKQEGYGMKYAFYVFYPAHVFVLFYLANFVMGKG